MNDDRERKIQNQAGMHFASRITAAKIEKGDLETDQEIKEELNKWMNQFQKGIRNSRIPVNQGDE